MFNRPEAISAVYSGNVAQRVKLPKGLYGQLCQESSTPRQNVGSVRAQFVSLPLCVRMLADFVQNDGLSIGPPDSNPILQRILTAICEREIARQGLITSVENQLESFRDMAVTYHDDINPRFEIDDLFLCTNGFDDRDLNKVIDHALIAQPDTETTDDRHCFRYDFLGPHLRAVAIAGWLRAAKNDFIPQDVVRIMEKEAEGKGHVLEQLSMCLDPNDDFPTVMQRCRSASRSNDRVASFIFHVAQALVGRNPEVTTAEERARMLFSEINGPLGWTGGLDGWTFRGLIDRLDLRGLVFTRCKFISVSFRNCTADGTTVFENCVFEGDLGFEPKTAGWRRTKVQPSCQMKFPTDAIWEDVLQRRSEDYSARAEEILRIGLRKFWRHGRIKRSLKVNDWKKGGLSRFGQAAKLMDIMLNVSLVNKAHISGVEEGGRCL